MFCGGWLKIYGIGKNIFNENLQEYEDLLQKPEKIVFSGPSRTSI